MNLFTARLTGKMLSTDAFEKEIADMQARVKRWRQIEKSPELAEYLELKKIVESNDFQERKNELVNRKYNDTQEGKMMTEYESLYNSSSIRRYRRALKDEEFQAFLVFRESEDFRRIKSIKEVLTDPMIRKYNMLYYSSYYKNYLKVLNSPDLKRLGQTPNAGSTRTTTRPTSVTRSSPTRMTSSSSTHPARRRSIGLSSSVPLLTMI